MSHTVIIPARMASSRLPGKPLLDIGGIPMVVRVAQRARLSQASRVVVATDHPDIEQACHHYGVEVVMTNENHPTGTDRLAQAVELLGLEDNEIVVNVQGDEPLMPVAVIDAVAQLLKSRPDCAMATAAHTISDIESFLNPNVVKVITDYQGSALTFSRAPIPWPRDHFRKSPKTLPDDFCALHHLGIYSYRVRFLKKFPTLKQAPLEVTESLEQLRALWYGEKIALTVLDEPLPAGVDTQEDLQRVRSIFALDLSV